MVEPRRKCGEKACATDNLLLVIQPSHRDRDQSHQDEQLSGAEAEPTVNWKWLVHGLIIDTAEVA